MEDESAEEDATGNKTGFHARQITMYNDTEICFDTEIRAGEGAGYDVDDELVIKGAELDLPATLSVSYADTGFPVYGKSVMAGGLSGSHEESVENLVVYDRVHDKDYAITADGVIAAEKYVIMLFDSEENLDK